MGSSSKATVDRIKRLRKERRNLEDEIERSRKLADSEATILEGEVKMLHSELKLRGSRKLTDSSHSAFDVAFSMLYEEQKGQEQKALADSKTALAESRISRLRDDVRMLRMDLPRSESDEELVSEKKLWWRFFH